MSECEERIRKGDFNVMDRLVVVEMKDGRHVVEEIIRIYSHKTRKTYVTKRRYVER